MDLLNQSYDRAKNNLEDVDLGKIASGKIEIGEHIMKIKFISSHLFHF